MKDLKLPIVVIALIIFLSQVVAAQTTEFSYQGKLADAGMSLTTYDFEFALYDVEVGGAALGTLPRPGVSTANGTFKVNLDFGAATFTGANRWLEVSVKRPADPDFTTLTPRVLITSSPYSIKSIASDTAADSLKLGGVDASEYVTTSSVAGTFVKNDTAQQTANFNVSGTGVIGNNLGIGVAAPQADLKLDVGGNAVFRTANGNINFGTPNSETGMSITRSLGRADMRFNGGVLKLVAGGAQGPPPPENGVTVSTEGNVGIGIEYPDYDARLTILGNTRMYTGGSAEKIQFGTPNGETGMSIGTSTRRADIRFNESTLKLVAGIGSGPPDNANGVTVDIFGKVGVGVAAPETRFHVRGGSSFFQGDSTPLPATAGKGIVLGFAGEQGYISGYDYSAGQPKNLLLNNGGGNVGIGTTAPRDKLDVAGNAVQDRSSNGLVKAMVFVSSTGQILRCYNGVTGNTNPGCGFIVDSANSEYVIDFGFQINDRFFSVSPSQNKTWNSANSDFLGTNSLYVFIFAFDGDYNSGSIADFMVIIY